MVKTALETSTSKNVNAPIIVMGHHGIANTAYVTNEWKGNYGEGTEEDMVALFKQYSQVIHISGHPYVKHTTKKFNSEKQKTQATKIVDLIAWVFCFCIVSYSKRSWTL